MGVVPVPVPLSSGPREGLPLILCTRVFGENDVAWKAEDFLWQGAGAQGLVVEKGVPNTGRAILWIALSRRVDKELFARGVCTEESDEVMWGNGLVLEELNELVGTVVDAWKKAVRGRLATVFPAYKDSNSRSKRASYDDVR